MRWQLPDGAVFLGRPAAGDARWVALDDFASGDRIASTYRARSRGASGAFTGNWIFQNLTTMPLLVAGYFFLAQQRAPSLSGNVLLDAAGFFQNMVLAVARFTVLAGDSHSDGPGIRRVTSMTALREALRGEIESAYGPIVAAFQARRLVSRANAWASVLDSLHRGFLLAGRTRVGLDAAWSAWDALLEGWEPGTRRRPRRIGFTHRGANEELTVHAACCLVFMASGGMDAPEYCAVCPVRMPDDERIARTASWLDRVG